MTAPSAPVSPPASTPAIVEAIDDRSGNVRILTLAPVQPFAWQAGQYAHLVAAGYEPRAYSIASAPPGANGHFNVHVRNTGGEFSTHLATETRLGDLVTVEGPFGVMTPAPAHHRPVLMVAGGTGIAPMLALAADILRHGITDEGITLVYGARSDADVYCRAELDALAATGDVRVHIVTGATTPDQELKRLGLNLSHHIVYASGPDPMMHSVHPVLLDHLADPERILTDVDVNRLQGLQP